MGRKGRYGITFTNVLGQRKFISDRTYKRKSDARRGLKREKQRRMKRGFKFRNPRIKYLE